MELIIQLGDTIAVKQGNKIKMYLAESIYRGQIVSLQPYNIKGKPLSFIKMEKPVIVKPHRLDLITKKVIQ